MVLRARGGTVSDVFLIAILVAFFALAIGLVQVLSRMLERDTDADSLADEPPDIGESGVGVHGPVRP
jgi:hypothetical protein